MNSKNGFDISGNAMIISVHTTCHRLIDANSVTSLAALWHPNSQVLLYNYQVVKFLCIFEYCFVTGLITSLYSFQT